MLKLNQRLGMVKLNQRLGMLKLNKRLVKLTLNQRLEMVKVKLTVNKKKVGGGVGMGGDVAPPPVPPGRRSTRGGSTVRITL